MAVATGVNEVIGYVAEANIGETPANPVFKILETTGFNVNETRETIQDNRLGNRNRKCNKQGNIGVTGDVPLLLEYDAYDDLLAAAFCADWETDAPAVGSDRLVNSNLRKGFTFMRRNPELGGSQYRYYKGCEIGGFSLELTQNDNIAVTFSVIGVESTPIQAMITGATTSPAPGGCSFDYKHGSFQVDGSPVANITAFSFAVENNIEASHVLFSQKTGAKPIGKFDATGSVTAQFDDELLYNKFINDEKAAIVVTMEDAASGGNKLVLTIPKAMLSNPTTDTSGDGEITLSAEFTGEYDAGIDGTVQLVRTPAA